MNKCIDVCDDELLVVSQNLTDIIGRIEATELYTEKMRPKNFFTNLYMKAKTLDYLDKDIVVMRQLYDYMSFLPEFSTGLIKKESTRDYLINLIDKSKIECNKLSNNIEKELQGSSLMSENNYKSFSRARSISDFEKSIARKHNIDIDYILSEMDGSYDEKESYKRKLILDYLDVRPVLSPSDDYDSKPYRVKEYIDDENFNFKNANLVEAGLIYKRSIDKLLSYNKIGFDDIEEFLNDYRQYYSWIIYREEFSDLTPCELENLKEITIRNYELEGIICQLKKIQEIVISHIKSVNICAAIYNKIGKELCVVVKERIKHDKMINSFKNKNKDKLIAKIRKKIKTGM